MRLFRRVFPLVALWLALASGAEAVQIVSPSGPELRVDRNKGILVRLDSPAASVFIADPEIADVQVKSPSLIYVFGRRTGETTLFAVDGQQRILAGLPVKVGHDIDGLRQALAATLPGTAVTADSVGHRLMIGGTVRSAGEAEEARRLAAAFVADEAELVNRLKVDAPNQVNLRVRVAEVNRDVVKRFGIDWDAALSLGGLSLGLSVGNVIPSGTGVGVVASRALGAHRITGSGSIGGLDLNGVVDLMEGEGLLSILAEPNLTAMSGETASFLAGGEFPIPVPQTRDTITIEFKKFGVSLEFTPVLVGDGRISMKVAPEVSELSDRGALTLQGFSVPGITTRRAETTVELASGQTFAVAGLLKSTVDQDVSKLPGLADLPVIGALFRSDSFRSGETELVILITPYLVRPVAAPTMALPTDGFTPPTDAERILGRRTTALFEGRRGEAPAAVPARGTRLAGPVGFMLD